MTKLIATVTKVANKAAGKAASKAIAKGISQKNNRMGAMDALFMGSMVLDRRKQAKQEKLALRQERRNEVSSILNQSQYDMITKI